VSKPPWHVDPFKGVCLHVWQYGLQCNVTMDSHSVSLLVVEGVGCVDRDLLCCACRSHPMVMQAWKDFKADYGLTEDLTPIDTHGAFFQKIKDVKVDMSKMRSPRDANKP